MLFNLLGGNGGFSSGTHNMVWVCFFFSISKQIGVYNPANYKM